MRQIYIYGAGYIGQKAFYMLRKMGVTIDAFLDNYKKENIENIICINPEEALFGNNRAFVFVAVENYREVEEELISYGLKAPDDYTVLCEEVVLHRAHNYLDINGNKITGILGDDLYTRIRLSCFGKVFVGDDVHVGNVFISCCNFAEIIIEDDVWIDDGCELICEKGSKIIIGKGTRLEKNTVIKVYRNSRLVLHGINVLGEMSNIFVSSGSQVEFGKQTDTDKDFNMRILNSSKCIIGEDCMFSYEVSVRAEDGHPIVDRGSGVVLNNNKDVYISDHCWIGMRTTILGGCTMYSGCMAAACALINSTYSNNSLIVGIPGRVLRNDIDWKRSF